MRDLYAPYRLNKPLNHEDLPEPIYKSDGDFIELYWKAWDLAWDHVLYRKDSPQPFYLDEAMTPKTIWIWDTCFMSLFCRYAPDIFPGIESLNNFYFILHDHKKAPFKIHFADNPPLFAWVEWEYFKMTGDQERLQWLLSQNHYLEKHFDFIENAKKGKIISRVNVPISIKTHPLGYKWRGNTSGMDNTPRGRNWHNDRFLNKRRQIAHNNVLWLDLLAQQALSAENIAKIAKVCNNSKIQQKYEKIYKVKTKLLNEFYWDETDQIYYDIRRKSPQKMQKLKDVHDSNRFNKVQTTAAYWPLLAGMCSRVQAQSLAEKAVDPNIFGGDIPWPSLSRNDEAFEPLGRYWRGGIWLPNVYMATKGLERYGYYQIADENAEKFVKSMVKTYQEYEPHTIWEVYSPTEAKPSTLKDNIKLVREDFCGWSALGPISMFIENILGFHEINYLTREIQWRIHHHEPHGIKRLKFGSIQTDLLFQENLINIQSNEPYSLHLIDKSGKKYASFEIKKGHQSISVNIQD